MGDKLGDPEGYDLRIPAFLLPYMVWYYLTENSNLKILKE